MNNINLFLEIYWEYLLALSFAFAIELKHSWFTYLFYILTQKQTERQMQTDILRMYHENNFPILKLWTLLKLHIMDYNLFPLDV